MGAQQTVMKVFSQIYLLAFAGGAAAQRGSPERVAYCFERKAGVWDRC